MEDTRTNSLIITDVPQQFEIIENTIAKLDVPVPQILIEVEMLDVSKSTADQLGITYGATLMHFYRRTKAVNYPFSESQATASLPVPVLPVLLPVPVLLAPVAYTPGSFNASGMTATLNFLTTQHRCPHSGASKDIDFK